MPGFPSRKILVCKPMFYLYCRQRALLGFHMARRMQSSLGKCYPSRLSESLENSKHYLQYTETPEVLFCVVFKKNQITSSPCSDDGLVYPILSSSPTTGTFSFQITIFYSSEILITHIARDQRVVALDRQIPRLFNVSLQQSIMNCRHLTCCLLSDTKYRRFQNTMYIIPKGSVIPENMALLRDERIVPDWEHYTLVNREPCLPEVHEQNAVDFVVKNESRLCFQCVNRPPPHNF